MKLTVDLIRDWETEIGEDFFDQCDILSADTLKLFEFIKVHYPNDYDQWISTFEDDESWFLCCVLNDLSHNESDEYDEELRCKHFQIVCDYINSDQELLDKFIQFLEENPAD